jgi:uncharacterized membrane protein
MDRDSNHMTTTPMFSDMVRNIESDDRLDDIGERARSTAERLTTGSAGSFLRGDWLGHALHPMLTDAPLGCWMSASLLDLVGGRKSRTAARRLVGLGLLASLPTAAAGSAELPGISDKKALRVATVHGIGNVGVMGLYLLSWRSRRRGHHLRGAVLALAGGGMAAASGYLGGHLSFAQRVGTGERGTRLPPPVPGTASVDDLAARHEDDLTVMTGG